MIPRNQIPPCLWKGDTLHLPDEVHDIYEATLKEHGLFEKALSYEEGGRGGHGGGSKDETNEHFAKRYLNSISRVQCVMLDPLKSFEDIPKDLLLTLSSHRILILDIPCGAGAGAISLLVTLKVLRMNGILPMTPLTVRIIGADLSPYALDLYRRQLEQFEPLLAMAAISVSLEVRLWDAVDVQQTNDLIDDYLGQAAPNEYLVLVANFSGASKTLFPKFQESFKQVWIRLSGKASMASTILWVEPKAGEGVSLFKKLRDLVNPYNWFKRTSGERMNHHECEYNWFIRLQNKVISSGVMVHLYSRKGGA